MKTTTKSHFAASYNMARRNSHTILKHIAHMSGIVFNTTENQLHEIEMSNLMPKNRPEQKDYVTRRLYKHFPFIQTMTKKEKEKNSKFASPSDVGVVLTNMFKLVSLYRNNYTHYCSDNTNCFDIEKRVVGYLNECFTVALRIIKERFELSINDVKFIDDYRYKNGEIVERTQKNGKTIETTKTIKVPNPNFDYAIISKDWSLTEMGKVFLVCQFIEKRYATMLFDALGEDFYFKYDKKQRMIIREVFSAFSIKMPRERIDSERNDMMLALDMLNELKKCPSELFDHLSEDDKNKFKVNVSTDLSLADKDPTKVLLRRYGDRFPQLALRYIDDLCLFKNLRFHVNYGKYRKVFTETKSCIDNIERIRVIQKELNGFGRINEIEKRRIGNVDENYKWDGVSLIRPFKDVSRDDTSKFPYITDSKTRYLFNGEKIGIAYYYNDRCRNGIYMPNVLGEFMNINPVCWLSIYEIPALIFHTLLEKHINRTIDMPKTENVIINCINNYIKFFKDFKNGSIECIECADKEHPQNNEYKHIEESYGIDWSDIPRKIQDFIVGRDRESFESHIKPIINNMISRTQTDIDRFIEDKKRVDTKDNKMGKDTYVEIRPGRLATFLARDILMFQPSNNCGRDKLTGLNYRVMQASIAMYNSQVIESQTLVEFKAMFVKAGIIGDKTTNKHPFLEAVLNKNPQNTLELYEYYLAAKIVELERIQKDNSYKEVYFLHSNRQKWAEKDEKYYQELADSYLENPIELPRSIFENSIKSMLLTICEENKDLSELAMIAKQEQCSVTYLISKYMEFILKDKSQNFYAWSRDYEIFNLFEPGSTGKTLEERIDINIKSTKAEWLKNMTKELELKIKHFKNYGSPSTNDSKEKLKTARFEQQVADYLLTVTDNGITEFESEYRKYKKDMRKMQRGEKQPFNPSRHYISKYRKGFIKERLEIETNKANKQKQL